MAWTIGKASFEVAERSIAYEGKEISGTITTVGKLTSYVVKTSDLSTVIFGVVTWPSGNTEVIPIDVLEDGEQKYQRLQNAGRMSVANLGNNWVIELNAMKHNHENGRANLASASKTQLSEIAEADVDGIFSKFGTVRIGTKSELYGETNKNRDRLALLCENGNSDMLAAAYVITRVLAILKDFGM